MNIKNHEQKKETIDRLYDESKREGRTDGYTEKGRTRKQFTNQVAREMRAENVRRFH